MNNLAPKIRPLFVKYSPDLYGDRPDSRYIYVEPKEGRVTLQVRQKNDNDSSDIVGEISLLTACHSESISWALRTGRLC